jgi:hypothetical protein
MEYTGGILLLGYAIAVPSPPKSRAQFAAFRSDGAQEEVSIFKYSKTMGEKNGLGRWDRRVRMVT